MRPRLIDVYQKDKEVYKIGTAMTMAGFAYDVEAAQAMREKLLDMERHARAKVEEAVGRKLRMTKTGGISTADLHQAVFKEMRAPVLYRSGITKTPSLGVHAMRAYAGSARPEIAAFAIAELERKRAAKLRATYIDKVLRDIDDRRRVFANWRTTGTVSGRWSSQKPNLQQLPRKTSDPTIVWGKDDRGEDYVVSGGIRSLYIAPPGYKIVAFDFKQLEFRIAAHISGDPNMLRVCEASDIHAVNAELVWGDAFRHGSKKLRYELRQIAKNFGFAICYLAEAPTVYANIIANGQTADFAVIEAAIRELRKQFKVYFRWQHQRLLEIMGTGYGYSPLWGRRRYLSYTPRPTECANHHVQSAAADVFSEKLVAINDELLRRRFPGRLIAAVHDSGVAEVRADLVSDYQALVEAELAKEIIFTSSGKPLAAKFGIDWAIGSTWS